MGTISEVTGDLFDKAHGFEAIGHGVNCFGMMGAGIAVPFRNKYPTMYERYKKMCDQGFLVPGMVMHHGDPFRKHGPSMIYNIASQYQPGADARVEYLKAGLQWVRFHSEFTGIRSLGLPRIGAGIGGLTYPDVWDTVCEVFDGSPVNVTVVTL